MMEEDEIKSCCDGKGRVGGRKRGRWNEEEERRGRKNRLFWAREGEKGEGGRKRRGRRGRGCGRMM